MTWDSFKKTGEYLLWEDLFHVAKEYGMNVGSVASVIKTGGTCRNGMKFQRL